MEDKLNKKDCCENCYFWDKILFVLDMDDIKKSFEGICRRNAPRPVEKLYNTAEEALNNEAVLEIFFPKTSSWDFCGEWKPNQNE